ncbi:MAG: TonB-dependent receptor plug domain-containing protein, partial [Aquabacterium sp.]
VNLPQTLDEEVVEGQLRGQRGDHDLTAGFEARDETLHDPGLPGTASLARHRSAYLQDEWSALRGLTVTAGLRHDNHGLFGSHWSPRLYAVWRPAPQWTVKGGASSGFKAPNLKQIVPGTRREGPNDFIGNPALRPEVSRSFEIGGAWQAGRRGAQLMVFDQRVDDLIDVRLVQAGPTPGTGTYTYENLARARLRGLEAAYAGPLSVHPPLPLHLPLHLHLSYTYLDATSGNGQRLDRRPRHAAAARLDARSGPWRAGLQAEWQADQRLPAATVGQPSVAAPSVALWGAHLARQLPYGMEATLAVTNLTQLRLADRSPLFTQVEWPRTWRLALRGQW